MTCFHPRTIWVRNSKPLDFQSWTEQNQHNHNKPKMTPQKDYWNWTEIQVPCNTCIGCKLDHSKMWACRCAIEAKMWKNNCFITLTYNNPNLPKNSELVKKDIQDFMKRLRFHEEGTEQWTNPNTGKEEKPIRYLICGEYGTKSTLRPHYHGCLFNWKPDDLKPYKKNKNGDMLYTSAKLQKIWGKGFVIIGELSYKSASYIARYTMKKAGLKPKPRMWKYNKDGTKTLIKRKYEREPEFLLMSRGVGIGRTWWEENKEFCKKWGHIDIKIGNKVSLQPLPRYFKKLWEKEDWEGYEIFKYEQAKQAAIQLEEKIQKNSFEGICKDAIISRILEKDEHILLAKAQSLKRTNFI